MLADLRFELTPWAHQLEALAKFENRDRAAFFLDTGCGKTATTIHWIRLKELLDGEKTPWLILCPKVVCNQWQREFTKHAPDLADSTAVLTGTSERKIRDLKRAVKAKKRIFITNHESLVSKKFVALLESLRLNGLVVDESHKFKSPTAVRTKTAIRLSKTCRYAAILTGSPITNKEMDLWSQFEILGVGCFPDSYYVFRNRFFIDKNVGMPRQYYFPNWVPRPETRDQLAEIIAEHSFRAKKEDVLKNLPPLVKTERFVDLPKELYHLYCQMEQDFVAEMEELDAPMVARLAITKMLRLRQICCGVVKTDDGSVRLFNTEKLNLLEELVSDITDNGHKVIIWSDFVPTYKQIGQMLDDNSIGFTTIVGGQSDKERQQNIDNFQNDDRYQVIIANPAAGGVGVNLTAASYSIFYSRSFSYENEIQAEARNYRGGSEIHDSITRIDLTTSGTVEEDIALALENKKDVASLVEMIKAKWRVELP